MSKRLTEKQAYRRLVKRQMASLKLQRAKISQYKTTKGQKAQLARVNLLAKKYYNVRAVKFPVLEKFAQITSEHKITRIVKRDSESARDYKKYVKTNLQKLYRQIERASKSNVKLNLKKISFKAFGGVSTVQGLLNWFKYDVPETSAEFKEREAVFQGVLKALKRTKYDNTTNKLYSPQFSLGDVSVSDIAMPRVDFRDWGTFDIGSRIFDLETITYQHYTLYVYFISQKMVLVDIEDTAPFLTDEKSLSQLKWYIDNTFDDVRVDINDFIKKSLKKS